MIDNCHNCGGALVEQRRALSQCDGCGDHVVSDPMVEKLKAERDQLRDEVAALLERLRLAEAVVDAVQLRRSVSSTPACDDADERIWVALRDYNAARANGGGK